MPTVGAIEKAIDDSYMLGQIDVLSYILNLPAHASMLCGRALAAADAFERERDEFFWRYTAWCLAHNIAVACMGEWGRD